MAISGNRVDAIDFFFNFGPSRRRDRFIFNFRAVASTRSIDFGISGRRVDAIYLFQLVISERRVDAINQCQYTVVLRSEPVLLRVDPQKPKKNNNDRIYKTGPKTGEKHASSLHGSRKGFSDFVDITNLGETRTHKPSSASSWS